MFEFEDSKLTVKDREDRETKVSTYEQQLREHPDVPANYLRGRGFTGQVAKALRLGYVQDPLPGDESHRGRLVIPYLTRAGVTWIKTRALPGSVQEDVKYKYITSGAGGRLYNTRSFTTGSKYIALTEGELDAAVFDYMCGVPAVGMPGASNWRSEYKALFVDFDTVFVVMDGDTAGRTAGKLIQGDLKQQARMVYMADGVDVNGLFVEHGRQAVRDLIGV